MVLRWHMGGLFDLRSLDAGNESDSVWLCACICRNGHLNQWIKFSNTFICFLFSLGSLLFVSVPSNTILFYSPFRMSRSSVVAWLLHDWTGKWRGNRQAPMSFIIDIIIIMVIRGIVMSNIRDVQVVWVGESVGLKCHQSKVDKTRYPTKTFSLWDVVLATWRRRIFLHFK